MALCDPEGILASPFAIIDCRGDTADVEAIIEIIHQHQVGQIVAGLPLSMNGSAGEQVGKVRVFIQKLASRTEVPIEFRDERLTTVSARNLMRTVRKPRKKARHDAIAAALILQGYLDEKRQAVL